jgi:hypothetical protein
MTCAITNDFPHHPYTGMSQPTMLDLECINILEKLLHTQHVERVLCMCSTIQTVRKVFFLEYYSHLR